MSFIKKNFEEIYTLLNANQDEKVGDIMNQLINLMASKQRDKNDRSDEHGLWIFCYYHKEWELITQVEYGNKASSSTGYNSMCKVGVNAWTKQQRDFKTNKADLLEEVIVGRLEASQLADEIERLEEIKDSIIPLIEYHEVIAHEINDEMIAREEAEDE